MAITPDFNRCCLCTLFHMILFFFVPVWTFALLAAEMDVFGALALGIFTAVTLVFFVPISAVFVVTAFRFTIDAELLTWDAFGGSLRKQIPVSEITLVRSYLFVYSVSRGVLDQGIPLPAMFLLDRQSRNNLAEYLRENLTDGHPLLRLAR